MQCLQSSAKWWRLGCVILPCLLSTVSLWWRSQVNSTSSSHFSRVLFSINCFLTWRGRFKVSTSKYIHKTSHETRTDLWSATEGRIASGREWKGCFYKIKGIVRFAGVEKSALPLRHQKERTFALGMRNDGRIKDSSQGKLRHAQASCMWSKDTTKTCVDSTWTTEKITVLFINVKRRL